MAITCPRRLFLWLFPVLLVATVLSMYVFSDQLTGLKRWALCNAQDYEFRKSIGDELSEIQQKVRKLFLYNKAPSPTLLVQLEEIVKRLDPREDLASVVGQKVDDTDSLDVCPEVYKGTKFGYPFYSEGWALINCTNAKPLRSVVSVLVNTVAYPKQDEGHIETVLKGITETYPTVQVYLATGSDSVMKTARNYQNVNVVVIDKAHVAKGWNALVRKASTPYVLIARDVFHFTWLTQLERQIRVVSQLPYVEVAGGSYRNFSGHWKAGCVQTTMKNYAIKYQEGYLHSKNECMFCDYLQGPFVTKKSLFKLDTTLPNEVVFEDWFSSVVQEGSLAMSCPDAMYFTTDYWSYSKRNNRNVWTPLAKKWELNRVLLPGGVKHSFSCEDIGVTCKANSELLPLCCLQEYADALAFFQKFAEAHNFSFELDSGSTLGGVKFKGLVPWDLDGDFIISTSGFGILGKGETVDYFQKNGYTFAKYEDKKGYVRLFFKKFYIEIWRMGDVTNKRYLPPELQRQKTFTKANINGYWINTAFSPGFFSRNRYGREILKHSQSWIKQRLSSSWSEYNPEGFKFCKKPERHACIHNYPYDGDIPFMVN